MLKVVVSACVFALAVCAGSPAYAQSDRVSGNVLIGIGASRASGEADVLANVGIRATDYISLHGEVGTLPFKGYLANSDLLTAKHRATRYSGNIRFSYAEQSLVDPYLTAGFGGISVKKASSGRTMEIAPNVGLGFDVWPSKYVGVGVHYRALFIDQGTFHTFASGVVFGKR